VTYRQGLHSSSDNPSIYRTAAEEAHWKPNDPIRRCRKFLQSQDWWSAEWEDDVRQQHLATMKQAIEEAERNPAPASSTLFENVYSEMTPRLKAQRQLLSEIPSVDKADSEEFKFPI